MIFPRFIAAGCLLLLLASCAGAQATPSTAEFTQLPDTSVPDLSGGPPSPEQGRQPPRSEDAAQAPPSGGQPQLKSIPGVISFHPDGTRGVLEAPASVQAGQDFSITIRTFGGGCDEVGDTDVKMNSTGMTAEVVVHDRVPADPGVACPAMLKRLEHSATLRFEQPGTATIRIHGQKVGKDDGAPMVLEHTLEVQ